MPAPQQAPVLGNRTLAASMLSVFLTTMVVFLSLLFFSLWVMSDSLQPHGLQCARLLCPTLAPGVCSKSCPFDWWCYLTNSSSVILFSFCLQSYPTPGSFPVSWLFSLVGPSIGASASTSVLSVNIPGWFSLGLTRIDLLAVQGTLKNLLQHHGLKALIFHCSALMVQLSHPYMTTGKTIALTIWTFVSKVMSLLFNILSRFVIAFLPRSKLSYRNTSNHPWNFSWEATPLSTQSYSTVPP